MKKILIVALLGLFLTGCLVPVHAGVVDSITKVALAQKDTLTKGLSDMADSSKLTFAKVYGDAKAGIAGLASALKVGAEHVYKVLVMQQVVKSFSWLACILIPLLLMIFLQKRLYEWANDNSDASDGMSYVPSGIFTIICCVVFTVGLCHTDVILTGFINPEYGAIQDIFDFTK
jgi:hypothetical protein